MDSIEDIETIENNVLEGEKLMESEREIALKIMNTLDGTLVVRAIPILEFCLKAVNYTKFKSF